MRLSLLVALFVLLAVEVSAQPASRLFFLPTARPMQTSAEVGTRYIMPSVEANLGGGVSAGVAGLVLPRREGGINAGGLADVRVTLMDRERVALALGVTGGWEYSGGNAYMHVPFSALPYVAGTVGSETASATLGLGVRVQGEQAYRPPADCPGGWCPLSFREPYYRVLMRRQPVGFLGAEAEVARKGPYGVRLVGEAMALPGGDIDLLIGTGGVRVTRGAARLDLGVLVGSDKETDLPRYTQALPWVGLTAGF